MLVLQLLPQPSQPLPQSVVGSSEPPQPDQSGTEAPVQCCPGSGSAAARPTGGAVQSFVEDQAAFEPLVFPLSLPLPLPLPFLPFPSVGGGSTTMPVAAGAGGRGSGTPSAPAAAEPFAPGGAGSGGSSEGRAGSWAGSLPPTEPLDDVRGGTTTTATAEGGATTDAALDRKVASKDTSTAWSLGTPSLFGRFSTLKVTCKPASMWFFDCSGCGREVRWQKKSSL
mmetsp:Transcript_545/g.2071  ORF Transcript_545/g.2071 Transcript_545/m.2071 type:complete len:225 (+) Transcript_545:286-960(+)